MPCFVGVGEKRQSKSVGSSVLLLLFVLGNGHFVYAGFSGDYWSTTPVETPSCSAMMPHNR
jgi:hypothetical protein